MALTHRSSNHPLSLQIFTDILLDPPISIQMLLISLKPLISLLILLSFIHPLICRNPPILFPNPTIFNIFIIKKIFLLKSRNPGGIPANLRTGFTGLIRGIPSRKNFAKSPVTGSQECDFAGL